MRKLAYAGTAAGLALAALVLDATPSHAADHLDGPGAAMDPVADINDVYAWMTPDAAKVNLVMTVSPVDDGTRHFGPTRQYVFHVNSQPMFALGAGQTETKVICTFASDTSVQCWVGSSGYVTGDPSATTGLASADGKIKVFAGRRADPFFFNLLGFKEAVSYVVANIATLGGLIGTSADGCPNLGGSPATIAVAKAIGARLGGSGANGANGGMCTGDGTATPSCGTPSDFFANKNVLAISLQIDKTLLNAGGPVLSVWASTHAAP